MSKIEVSHGEVLDKHTILDIKSERIKSEAKLVNIAKEQKALSTVVAEIYQSLDDVGALHQLVEKLKLINEKLWDVEDALRVHEKEGDFGQGFIELARSVYYLNDERAAIKKAINTFTNSPFTEEKSYESYGNSGKTAD